MLAIGGFCAGGPTTTVNGTELLEHLARLRGLQPGRVARRFLPCCAELHARADARDRPRHRPRASVAVGLELHRADAGQPDVPVVLPRGDAAAAGDRARRSGRARVHLSGLGHAATSATAAPPPPPPTCTFTVSPTSTSYGPGGGSSAVTVTASASTCAWTASSNATWATLTGTAGGTGTGQVGYSVGPNSGLARSAQLTVAGAHGDAQPVGRRRLRRRRPARLVRDRLRPQPELGDRRRWRGRRSRR